MGNITTNVCVITSLGASSILNSDPGLEYRVVIEGKPHFIKFAESFNLKSNFFMNNKNIFIGLLYNDDWFENESITIDEHKLGELLKRKQLPNTPEEKLERLFLKLYSFQKEDGQLIAGGYIKIDLLWKMLYFNSLDEIFYYIRVLIARDLIYVVFFGDGKGINTYNITFEGLNHAINLNKEGTKSNKCFIAMSFKHDTIMIRNAIKDAITVTGFIPILVDELNIPSDKTINDEILSNIKRCNFCVADFTHHSPGVYFESGYALGLGKKVIYTCSADDFSSAHFDIKPLQHIVYDSTKQLTQDLINKIDFWIK